MHMNRKASVDHDLNLTLHRGVVPVARRLLAMEANPHSFPTLYPDLPRHILPNDDRLTQGDSTNDG